MRNKSKQDGRQGFHAPTPPRWKGRDSLQLVYQLNARVFTVLRDSSPQTGLWSMIDEPAIRRAARFPFLAVDVHFTDALWWRSSVTTAKSPTGVVSGLWPPELAHQLMSEVLVFAWHTVKWDRRVARLVLGMLPAVMDIITTLTPQQLDSIARRCDTAIRLRWEEDRGFWAQLIDAACRGDEERIAELHLYGQLLLSGQLLQQRP